MAHLRFKLAWEKAIQAIDYIAQQRPGLTQYYIGKIMFFADREHLLDYGRPVSGDRYFAMEHGPVPSFVRDVLKATSDYPDEILDKLHGCLAIEQDGNKLKVFSKQLCEHELLSGSDKEYLLDAVNKYAGMSFGRLREISHEDPAYESAWSEPGNANEMDVALWFSGLANPQAALESAREYAAYGA